ncbi:MAG: hypothetical protein MUF21_03345 [Gemmatimonadaceae bacterium]|nr:hypothetical protein [Gemmatimonadaceae bacterium]
MTARTIRVLGADYLLPTWYPRAAVLGLAALDRLRAVGAKRTVRPRPALAQATIVIARPDHLGDLVQVTTLLHALRTQLPLARLVLLHGSWGRPLAQWLRDDGRVDALVEYDAAWLHAPGTSWAERLRRERETRASAAAALRALGPHVYLDMRLTTPNTLAVARAGGAAWIAGFGLRGESWGYDARIRYDEAASLPQNWLHVLEALDLAPVRYAGPVLPRVDPVDPPFIALQPGSRSTAKAIPDAVLRTLVPALADVAPVHVLGDARDRARYAWLTELAPVGRVRNRCGETTLPELVRVVGEAAAVVASESLVAHLALGHARPLVALIPARITPAAFPRGVTCYRVLEPTVPPAQVIDALRRSGFAP